MNVQCAWLSKTMHICFCITLLIKVESQWKWKNKDTSKLDVLELENVKPLSSVDGTFEPLSGRYGCHATISAYVLICVFFFFFCFRLLLLICEYGCTPQSVHMDPLSGEYGCHTTSYGLWLHVLPIMLDHIHFSSFFFFSLHFFHYFRRIHSGTHRDIALCHCHSGTQLLPVRETYLTCCQLPIFYYYYFVILIW